VRGGESENCRKGEGGEVGALSAIGGKKGREVPVECSRPRTDTGKKKGIQKKGRGEGKEGGIHLIT